MFVAPTPFLPAVVFAHRVTLVVDPTDTGKTWLACLLEQSAFHHEFTVRYARLPRMLWGGFVLGHVDVVLGLARSGCSVGAKQVLYIPQTSMKLIGLLGLVTFITCFRTVTDDYLASLVRLRL